MKKRVGVGGGVAGAATALLATAVVSGSQTVLAASAFGFACPRYGNDGDAPVMWMLCHAPPPDGAVERRAAAGIGRLPGRDHDVPGLLYAGGEDLRDGSVQGGGAICYPIPGEPAGGVGG